MELVCVVCDWLVGYVEDLWCGVVVDFEFVLVVCRIVFGEFEDVVVVCVFEGIDWLVVIFDNYYVFVFVCEYIYDFVLEYVCVLVFIDEDVLELIGLVG